MEFDFYYCDVICAIISFGEVSYFWNGRECLDIAFRICRNTLLADPPWFTIRLYSLRARGIKSDKSNVQRAILRNSDIVEP